MDKKLQRTENGPIAGVCAGMGEYFSVDPTLIRLGFAFLALFRGIGLVVYGICWLILPQRDGKSVLENLLNDRGQRSSGNEDSRIAGLALTGFGLVLLLHTVTPYLNWAVMVSALLIGGGVFLLYKAWKENDHGDE